MYLITLSSLSHYVSRWEIVMSQKLRSFVLPLSSHHPRFSWIEWWKGGLLLIHFISLRLFHWAAGREALTTSFVRVFETTAAKLIRLAKYAATNATKVFAICQSARTCDNMRQEQSSRRTRCSTRKETPLVCSNCLLEARFTQKVLQTMQNLFYCMQLLR